jgi:hypothetical protein
MIRNLIENLPWIELCLIFGVVKFYMGLLLILFLLFYSGFDLNSMSSSSIETTFVLCRLLFIAGFIYFGIALVLYLIEKKQSQSQAVKK